MFQSRPQNAETFGIAFVLGKVHRADEVVGRQSFVFGFGVQCQRRLKQQLRKGPDGRAQNSVGRFRAVQRRDFGPKNGLRARNLFDLRAKIALQRCGVGRLLVEMAEANGIDRGLQARAFLAHCLGSTRDGSGDPDQCDGQENAQNSYHKAGRIAAYQAALVVVQRQKIPADQSQPTKAEDKRRDLDHRNARVLPPPARPATVGAARRSGRRRLTGRQGRCASLRADPGADLGGVRHPAI